MTKSHIDRSIPPPAGIPRDVAFPEYYEEVLPNGLKLIVYEKHDLPLVSVNVVTRSGAMFDGSLPGLASMTAELLIKGTTTRSAVQIVEEIESLGGSIGANAGWDSMSVGVSILSRYLDTAIEVLADVFRNPTFAEEECERVREQHVAHILQRNSDPSFQAFLALQHAVYDSHPYGQPLEGTEQTISEITRERLAEFHRRSCTPANAFLIAVGDVKPDDILRHTLNHFGDLERGDEWRSNAAPISPGERKVHVVHRPTAVQSSIAVGHAGIRRNVEDYYAASMLNTIFGGYFGSRLNQVLREQKGFTYGAHSRFDARSFEGPFTASVDVRTDVTAETIRIILDEMERIRSERVGEEELRVAKNYIAGNFPMQIETANQVAQRIIGIELYGLGKSYYASFTSRILSLTPDDILHAARRYFHPERTVIALSGNAEELADTLSPFGSVTITDADGVPREHTQPSNG